MYFKINIILILALGVVSSREQNVLKINDPTNVNRQYITYKSEPKLYLPITTKNIDKAMLIQPEELQATPEYQGHFAGFLIGQNRNAIMQKYGLYVIPAKNLNKEFQKQFAWYMEDRLQLERQVNYVKADSGVYPDTHRSRRPGIYIKSRYSTVRNMNHSIRKIAPHYWIVAGPG